MRHTTPHTAPQPPDPPGPTGPGRPKRPTTSLNRRNPRPRDQPPDRAPEVPQRHQPPSALGAEPIVLDLLDAPAVGKAIVETKPDAIVHQATALASLDDFKHFNRSFAQTNRLRTQGTDALLAAAQAARVDCFVAQSFAGHRYARQGGPVKTEQDPLDPNPVPAMRPTQAAMEYLDQVVTDAGGIALRYGNLYGDPDDGLVEAVRTRKFPDRRRRRWRLVVHPPRGRRRRDRARARPQRPPASTTSSTTSPLQPASGCQRWRESSEPSRPCASPPARPAPRRRGTRRDGDRIPALRS